MRTPALLRRFAGNLYRWHGILGLNYHRIGDGRQSLLDRGLWSATAEDFDRQLCYLKANFDVIDPHDIGHALARKRGRHVLVSFDDGYADNYTEALPILRCRGVAATFFIATGFIDCPALPFWDEIAWMVRTSKRSAIHVPGFMPEPLRFDEPGRERAVQALLRTYWRLPAGRTGPYLEALAAATGSGRPAFSAAELQATWMTWSMIRGLHAAGMTIGGHTANHPILSRLTREQQMLELRTCQRRLAEEVGTPMDSFAYPFGIPDAFNADTRDCLRELGVRAAFSYYGGIRRPDEWDDLDIPRIAVEQGTTFDEFRANVMFPWAT